jgi:hypothetical protein
MFLYFDAMLSVIYISVRIYIYLSIYVYKVRYLPDSEPQYPFYIFPTSGLPRSKFRNFGGCK